MASAIKIIAGLFVLFIGFPIFIGGSAILLVVPIFTDDNGYFTTTTFHLQQDNVAAIRIDIPLDDVEIGVRIDPSKFVTLKMNAYGANNSEVFAGLTRDPSGFLDSISYMQITNFEYFEEFDLGRTSEYTIDFEIIANETAWAVPQSNEATWVRLWDSGTEFVWEPTYEDLVGGSISLILMTAGYSGTGPNDSYVNIYFNVGAKIPIINAIGWILVIFGGLLSILGIILVWSGFRTKKPRYERVRYYQGAPTQRVEPITKPTPKFQLQCSNCGSLNEPDSSFCSQCGEVLLSEDRTTVEEVSREKDLEVFEPTGTKLVVAEWGPRFWAWLIDIFVVGVITSILSSLVFFSLNNWDWWSFGIMNPFQWLFSLGPSSTVFFIYVIAMEYYYGQTIGKMVLNLEIISERTGERPTLGEIAISAVGKAFFLPLDIILGRITRDEKQVPDLSQRLTQQWSRTVVINQQKKKEESAIFVSSRV